MAEPTGKKQRRRGKGAPFKPGQSGNPAGRPLGSRNKLGEKFLTDLQDEWNNNGIDCLSRARKADPMAFARMVAGILPKELLVRKAPEEEMTDEELADTIESLARVAAELRVRGESIKPTHESSGTAQ